MPLTHRLTVELFFCAADQLAERQEQVAIWTQTVKDREEAYRVLKEGGGSDTMLGCFQIGELDKLDAAQAELKAWKNRLVEVGGTVPQDFFIAVPLMAVPTQIMATPPQPQLMAPALQPQVQARPGCA